MDRTTAGDLSDRELEALTTAATWYAKYHAGMIAKRADDPSAYALAQRERYLDLLSALAKLGIRVRNPLADQPAGEPGQVVPEPERRAA